MITLRIKGDAKIIKNGVRLHTFDFRPTYFQFYKGNRDIKAYHIEGQIGSGTYGLGIYSYCQNIRIFLLNNLLIIIVFRGSDAATGDKVALKKIKMEKEKEGFPVTAVREIKILKALRDKSIVQLKEIVTSFETGRTFFLNFHKSDGNYFFLINHIRWRCRYNERFRNWRCLYGL